ncbi:MAG: aromatic amino acid lyase, partial [Candidatus Marinimicrobia bacterium]|nr:aromatic amino acid lyase [Candidatus Neomarinimicrobiota bacterium]
MHKLKKHKGQLQSAGNVWRLLDKSAIVDDHADCDRIQDPYSFRCIPHVHGSSRELYKSAKNIVENEANSVSDNPLIFSAKEIRNSGHFHAEAVAQALDTLSISISEIGAISERRIHFFMKGIDDKIPMFVAHNPGLESGFMMAQVTAASLASENKTLAHPAAVDSISTSVGQEDLVSMAPWAGRKCLRIIENVNQILA